MTMPPGPPGIPAPDFLVDPGNPFVLAAQYPAQMATGVAQTMAGPRMVLSIRCGPASIAVMLTKEDADVWGRGICAGAKLVSTLMVVDGKTTLPGGLGAKP